MKLRIALPLVAALCAPAASVGQHEADARATARAERNAERSERMPSRPFTLRDPIPLPVRPVSPPGGEPVWRSCPTGESCRLEVQSPPGKLLVVTSLWSAKQLRCDDVSGGPTPAGQIVAPWWHCAKLTVEGQGAGVAGFFTSAPSAE